MKSKHIFLLVALLILTSCGATKQFTSFTHNKPLQEGKGRIYVIKPSFLYSGMKFLILCDNVLVGSTKMGSYLCWDVEDGMHSIGNAYSDIILGDCPVDNTTKINVKEGTSYYLKMWPKIGHGMIFRILDPKEGEQIIKGRKKPKITSPENTRYPK